MSTVTAILMASGYSRRLGGENKLLLFAPYTLALVTGLNMFDKIIFVCADNSVARLADGLPVTVLRNTHPEKGQRESIRLGVEASDTDFYLFFPCDMPFLDEATVRAVWNARQDGKITVPEHDGRPGNPVLFSKRFRAELLTLGEGEHARDIWRKPEVIRVPVPEPHPLMDIDTKEELAWFLSR